MPSLFKSHLLARQSRARRIFGGWRPQAPLMAFGDQHPQAPLVVFGDQRPQAPRMGFGEQRPLMVFRGQHLQTPLIALGGQGSRAPLRGGAYRQSPLLGIAIMGLCLVLWGSPVSATFHYTRHATPQSLTVGDIVDLQITVTHQGTEQVTPNTLVLPAAFLLRGTQYHRDISGNATVETWTYQITVFETGKHSIPEAQLHQQLPDGSTVIHKLPPIALNVVSLLPANAATVQGLKPLLDISLTLWPWLLGLCCLALATWWAWRKYRTKQHPTQPIIQPAMSPKDEALAAINTLTTSGLMMRGEYDKVYTEITDILKRFLARHYQQKMQEMTSSEVIQTLKEMDIDPWIHTDIRQLLAQADMVKFANAPSSEEACYQVITVLKNTIVGIATIAPPTEGDSAP